MRRKLTGLVASAAAAMAIAVAGCSDAPPTAGPDGSSAASSASARASSSQLSLFTEPPTTATSSSEGSSASTLSGLSDACSAVVDAQLTIAVLFAKPVNGHKLSAGQVTTAFSGIGPAVPHRLDAAVSTLRDAATRSVGKSDVQVAAILAEKPVAGALDSLSAFVKACSPTTG